MLIKTKKILYIYDEDFYINFKDTYKQMNLWPIGIINNIKYFYTNDKNLLLSNFTESQIVVISLYENYNYIEQNILNKYIYRAMILNITDIHISSDFITYKKNKTIIIKEKFYEKELEDIYNFLKILCNFRLIHLQDESGVFYVNFIGYIIGIRVSTFVGLKTFTNKINPNNILISLRFLKDVNNNFYNSIIYEEFNYKWLLNHINNPGLIVICGETGQGKTTFLYNLLEIFKEHFNIISLEDPVEKIINGIFQRELNNYMKNNTYDYNEILKSILRHNPDLITIGEIRDTDGAQFCTRSILTGHSILCTIHLNPIELNFNNFKNCFLKRFENFGVKISYIQHYIKGFIFLYNNYQVKFFTK